MIAPRALYCLGFTQKSGVLIDDIHRPTPCEISRGSTSVSSENEDLLYQKIDSDNYKYLPAIAYSLYLASCRYKDIEIRALSTGSSQRTARAVQTIAYNSHKWVNIPILKVWDDGYFETH
ncbi:hypothetical protein NQ317_015312 [Molorchus minor]|uniref:Uncharacterized protein n=1 Tax=Molorchus minor TaxID=1323400 RepID=A0ABQ9J1H8_9CUCU|nr:hypothetical protein NQ317_015312 [Molorchus minor]